MTNKQTIAHNKQYFNREFLSFVTCTIMERTFEKLYPRDEKKLG